MAPTSVVDKEQVSLPVKTAVATAGDALLGAVVGVLYNRIAKKFLVVRLFFVASMIGAMKGIRGKDDTKARVVAGFTSGCMLYLVGNMPSPPRVPLAIASGLCIAFYNGLVHEVESRYQHATLEDTRYIRTRRMLSELGLEDYEKHFKKHLLRDKTMHLLKERQV
ncbi:chloroplastic import inner membrane translocase subunit HP30-2-like [Papaver somniferum]|uniref:chloroplastic import inner membrane translocase subunit HP30-2-like n=1 Tax=Papaver somniferum TaxID=3469 RepID=UPI000E6F4EF2|nr:chloroplastic import inner membrane translocase subunit HP30-2-like [Papaver somniferum]